MTITAIGKVKHSTDCTRVFNRLDSNCPRCQQLAAGAPARKGWGDRRRQMDRQHAQECREHNCKRSNCGPVCTFGEW